MADKIKLLLAVLIAGAGITAFYYFGDQTPLYRVLGLLVAASISVAIAAKTQVGAGVLGFGRASLVEVRKVVWPSRKETMQTTLIVVAMVVVVGVLLWLFDMFLVWAIRLLTGQGG